MIATDSSSPVPTRYRVVTKPAKTTPEQGQEKTPWKTVGVAFVNRGKDGNDFIRVKLDETAEGLRELYLFVHEPKKDAPTP